MSLKKMSFQHAKKNLIHNKSENIMLLSMTLVIIALITIFSVILLIISKQKIELEKYHNYVISRYQKEIEDLKKNVSKAEKTKDLKDFLMDLDVYGHGLIRVERVDPLTIFQKYED